MNPVNPIYDEAFSLIEAEYQKIGNSTKSKDKSSCYNTIIQLKQAIYLTSKPEIYTDIKGFIRYYVDSMDEAVFDYDTIVFSKIEQNIVVGNINAKLGLYKYALKLLKANGYDDQANQCQTVINSISQEIFRNQGGLISIIRWFYLLTTKTAASILISIIMSIIISTIFLLPSKLEFFNFISYKTQTYSNFYFLNRVLNTLALMTGLDDEIKIKPINGAGVVLMIVGKGLFLLVIGNILFKQFKSRFNLE